MFLLAGLDYWHGSRLSPQAEVLPRLGAHVPAPVER